MYIPNIKTLGHMVSDAKIFYVFNYKSLCKTCDPRGWGFFLHQGHNLNKLSRGLLDDATYQIAMLYASRFHQEEFFMCFTIKAYVKHVTPWVGLFLAQGA